MTRVLNVNRREARRDLSELANMRRKLESTTQEVAVKADIAKRVMRENNELRYECAILRPTYWKVRTKCMCSMSRGPDSK